MGGQYSCDNAGQKNSISGRPACTLGTVCIITLHTEKLKCHRIDFSSKSQFVQRRPWRSGSPAAAAHQWRQCTGSRTHCGCLLASHTSASSSGGTQRPRKCLLRRAHIKHTWTHTHTDRITDLSLCDRCAELEVMLHTSLQVETAHRSQPPLVRGRQRRVHLLEPLGWQLVD